MVNQLLSFEDYEKGRSEALAEEERVLSAKERRNRMIATDLHEQIRGAARRLKKIIEQGMIQGVLTITLARGERLQTTVKDEDEYFTAYDGDPWIGWDPTKTTKRDMFAMLYDFLRIPPQA